MARKRLRYLVDIVLAEDPLNADYLSDIFSGAASLVGTDKADWSDTLLELFHPSGRHDGLHSETYGL